MWKKLAVPLVIALGSIYFIPPANNVDAHPFFSDRPSVSVIAHGSGQGLRPNNTLEAAELSHSLGAVIELDLHASKEGELIVRHDATVDATTNGQGLIKEKSLTELKQLDAGYWHDPDGDQHFLYRDKGIRIPTLQEVIDGTSGGRYVMEIKQEKPSIADLLCQTLRRNNIQKKTIVASFRDEALQEFRKLCPEVATSMSSDEVTAFVLMQKIGLSHLLPVTAQAMQVPVSSSGIHIVTPAFLKATRERGISVDVWTINDKAEMSALIEMGVDGIITDYPDRLKTLL